MASELFVPLPVYNYLNLWEYIYIYIYIHICTSKIICICIYMICMNSMQLAYDHGAVHLASGTIPLEDCTINM